ERRASVADAQTRGSAPHSGKPQRVVAILRGRGGGGPGAAGGLTIRRRLPICPTSTGSNKSSYFSGIRWPLFLPRFDAHRAAVLVHHLADQVFEADVVRPAEH